MAENLFAVLWITQLPFISNSVCILSGKLSVSYMRIGDGQGRKTTEPKP